MQYSQMQSPLLTSAPAVLFVPNFFLWPCVVVCPHRQQVPVIVPCSGVRFCDVCSSLQSVSIFFVHLQI